MNVQFSRVLFGNHTGSTFTVTVSDGQSISLTFKEIAEHQAPAGAEAFSLTFEGPESAFLPQGTYPFTHPVLPPFDMFIVPIGKAANGYVYEAVFTRYLEK